MISRLLGFFVLLTACNEAAPPLAPEPPTAPEPAPAAHEETVAPPPLVVEPVNDGLTIAPPNALEPTLVRSILAAHAEPIEACHEAASSLGGTLTLRLSVAVDGTVTSVERVAADFGEAQGFAILPLESCVHAEVLTWTFAAPSEPATITYPFTFIAPPPAAPIGTLGVHHGAHVTGS